MKKETINEVAAKLNENYRTEELFMPRNGGCSQTGQQ